MSYLSSNNKTRPVCICLYLNFDDVIYSHSFILKTSLFYRLTSITNNQ